MLEGDYVWGDAAELAPLPPALLERVEHYFSTSKLIPEQPSSIRLAGRYRYAHAAAVIHAALEDYRENFSAAQD